MPQSDSAPCKTPGAVFSIAISAERLGVAVEFGRTIGLTKRQAERLDDDVHDALEQVLAPHFACQEAPDARI